MTDTIISIGESGGHDYGSVTAAEAGEQKTLGTDERVRLQLYNDYAAGYLDDNVQIAGYGNLTATSYVILEAAPGNETNGRPNTGARIQTNNSFSGPLDLAQSYTRVLGLELINTNSAAVMSVQLNAANCIVDRCLITGARTASTGSSRMLWVNADGARITSSVAAVPLAAVDGVQTIRLQGVFTNTHLKNVSIRGGKLNNLSSSATPLLQDIVVFSNTTPYTMNGATPLSGSGNNASKNGATDTIPGSSPLAQNLVDGTDFMDVANLDFRLKTGSKLIGAGLNSGVAADISGAAFTVPYPIGAFKELLSTIAAAAIGSAEAFGAPSLSAGPATLIAAAISSVEGFGSPTIAPGAMTVEPPSIISAEIIPAPVFFMGPITLQCSGLGSLETFGASVVAPGAASIQPSAIGSAEASGTHQVTSGAAAIAPASISSQEAFGDPLIVAGAVVLLPAGIASNLAFGDPTLTVGAKNVGAESIGPGEIFGGAVLLPGAVAIDVASIQSGEAFGAAAITLGGLDLNAASIQSGEAFGDAAILPGAAALQALAIASLEQFGAASLAAGPVIILGAGIGSAEGFGPASLLQGPAPISAEGIPTLESFADPLIFPGAVVIDANGIATIEAFGTVTVIALSNAIGWLEARVNLARTLSATIRVNGRVH